MHSASVPAHCHATRSTLAHAIVAGLSVSCKDLRAVHRPAHETLKLATIAHTGFRYVHETIKGGMAMHRNTCTVHGTLNRLVGDF
eukprot:10832476-Alexandrium_andersonii.AAC.1